MKDLSAFLITLPPPLFGISVSPPPDLFCSLYAPIKIIINTQSVFHGGKGKVRGREGFVAHQMLPFIYYEIDKWIERKTDCRNKADRWWDR